MIKIVPLSEDNMPDALSVLDAEFGHEKDSTDNYRVWLPNSLLDGEPKIAEALAKIKLDFLKYWVALDLERKKVVGVTGVYSKSDQPNLAWLAWTSVQEGTPDLREVENDLIDFSASIARSLGKESLVDYFDDSEEDANIRELLYRNGFAFWTLDEESEAPDGAIHYKLDLRFNF